MMGPMDIWVMQLLGPILIVLDAFTNPGPLVGLDVMHTQLILGQSSACAVRCRCVDVCVLMLLCS